MTKASSCIICKSQALSRAPAVVTPFIAARVYKRATFATTLLSCQSCGMRFYEPRFTNEELGRLYSGYRDEQYLAQRNAFEPWYTKRLNGSMFDDPAIMEGRQHSLTSLVGRYDAGLVKRAKAILDYGGDDGRLVYGIFDGVQKYVHDISGTPLKPGLLPALPPQEIKYDLVICSNVLEHVPDPLGMLQHIAEFSSEGTVVYVEVPNENPYGFGTLKKRVAQQAILLAMRPKLFAATFGRGMFTHMHEHINYFSEKTLHALFARNGFTDISVTAETINGLPNLCGFARKGKVSVHVPATEAAHIGQTTHAMAAVA